MVYELQVPKELGRIECHLSWLRELLPFLETSGEDKAPCLVDYLKLLLKEEAKNQINEFGKVASSWVGGGVLGEEEEHAGEEDSTDQEDQTEDGGHTLFGYLGLKLNLVAFYTYLHDFQAARCHLAGVRKTLEGEMGKPGGSEEWSPSRLTTVRYCFSAAEWAIKLMEHFEIIPDAPHHAKVPEDIAKESGALLRKWGTIQDDGDAMATISFLKGCLGAALKIKEEETLKLFRKAVDMDPNYHVWYHYAYRKLRRIRRSYREWNHLKDPSKEEYMFCEKALELKPDDLITVLDYALLIKESLWTKPPKVWAESKTLGDRCIEMFQRALSIAEIDGTRSGKRFAKKIKIYLGEFYVFGKYWPLQDRGKALLDECVEANPKSTFALHKAAKLYHLGTFGTRKFQDPEKAKKYYIRALEANSSNFPCLMDYLKLLRDTGNLRESIAAIDSFLVSSKRDAHMVRVLIERGCLLWVLNTFASESFRKQACESWIRALVGYPDRAEDVYDIMKRPYRVVHGIPTYINKFLVIQTLEGMKEDVTAKDEMEAICTWLAELKKSKEDNGQSGKRTDHDGGKENVYCPPHKRHEKGELADALKGLFVTGPSEHPSTGPSRRRLSSTSGVPTCPPLCPRQGGSHRRNSEADDDSNWRKHD